MKAICSIRILKIAIAACWLASCSTGERSDTDRSQTAELTGEQTAKKYCSSCHLFPDPGLLDKTTWAKHALPAMGYRFGIYRDRSRESLLEKGIARGIVERANVFPTTQTITDEEWNAINKYYDTHAPEKLSIVENRLVTPASLFEPSVSGFVIARPAISALGYDEAKQHLYVADCSRDNYSSVSILDRSFKPITTLGLPHPVSNLTLHDDALYILSMGHFVPSDEPAGQLLKAVKDPSGKYNGYLRVLKDLKRPVDLAFADLNSDGIEDIVICEFGNHTGRVSLFTKSKRSYVREILLDAPGASKVEIEDMNHDGKPDIVVLMAQGDEGVDIYFNNGNGKFTRVRILRFPSVYGSTSICLKDFNKDGLMDIVYVNGDNGDASRIVKPYHGIRVFLNNLNTSFLETYFFPMPGAYKAIVSDFDKDGDEDIAAISFFTDARRHEQGFIYFENISEAGTFGFSPHVVQESNHGRWITMTACDVNKDGFKDIVLGSFTSMQVSNDTLNSPALQNVSLTEPLLVLKNAGRKIR